MTDITDCLSTTEAAKLIGVTPGRLRQIAWAWGKERVFGVYIWDPEEIERLRNRGGDNATS